MSPRVPRFQTHLSVREGSDIATCHMTLGLPPGRGGLRYHHVSRGSRPTFRCRRTLASPHVPWHQTRHLAGRALVWPRVSRFQIRLPVWEGSVIATCPVAPGLPPGRGGLWRHHVSRGTRPAPWQGRALVSHGSQHAMGHKQKGNTQPIYLLSWVHLPPRCACAFPRRLTSGSS
jgi:hypothetical protein